jgi:hypothetical protein
VITVHIEIDGHDCCKMWSLYWYINPHTMIVDKSDVRIQIVAPKLSKGLWPAGLAILEDELPPRAILPFAVATLYRSMCIYGDGALRPLTRSPWEQYGTAFNPFDSDAAPKDDWYRTPNKGLK